MKNKKMLIAAALTAAMLLTTASAGLAQSALNAFSALTGQTVTLDTVTRTPDECLDKVMAGDYLAAPADDNAANRLALELGSLSAVTTKDIAVYAAAHQHPAAMVRNHYFRSLANVLRAEIQVNPAAQEEYRNVQIILSLFLSDDEDNITRTTREAIRATITDEHAQAIADQYSLPPSFVEFIIMDENWDDDSWQNDNSWQAGSDWNTDDLYDDSLEDYIDTDGIDGNSADDSPDAASVDGNSVNYASADAASVDTNSPDYNSPDYSSPDYSSPDYSSPDYATPDYDTPDYSSPDYSSPASVDESGSYDS